jgi:hypothetical protein
MRKIAIAVLGIASGLLGLCLIPTVFYNACGLAGMQDCADDPKWESWLVILVGLALISGLFFLSYRLFRLVARR